MPQDPATPNSIEGAECAGASPSSPPSNKRDLYRVIAVFTSGNTIALILNLVAGLLAARLVSPSDLGAFNGYGLVLGYLAFLHLGIPRGLMRELPYYVSRGAGKRATELAASAQGWSLVLALIAGVAMLALALWSAFHGHWGAAAGWGTFAVNGALLFYATNYLEVTFRTTSDFARLAVVQMARAVAAVLFLAAVWAFGFYGLCLRSLGVGLVGLLLLWFWRPVIVRPCLVLSDLRHLLKIGAPIFAVGQAYAWWTILDRTLVLHFMKVEGLGLYALATLSLSAMYLLPRAVTQVTYPRMVERYGRSGTIAPLARYVSLPVLFLVVIMVPAVCLAWFFLPYFTRMVLPNYLEGVAAAQWSLLLALVTCFQPLNSIFVTVNKQHLYFVAIVTGIIAYGATLAFLGQDGWRIEVFPQAMIVGRVVFILICLAFVYYLIMADGQVENRRAQ